MNRRKYTMIGGVRFTYGSPEPTETLGWLDLPEVGADRHFRARLWNRIAVVISLFFFGIALLVSGLLGVFG